MTKFYFVLVALALITINVSAQENNDLSPREKVILETVQGTVTKIVKETREITLMGVEGNLMTMTAGEAVERFDEIAVNDIITFDSWTYLKAEFRQPTAEELEEPIVMLAEGGKAPEGMDPGAAIGAIVKAIVTIEVLNRPSMLATVKGPQGNYLTIQMEDEELIQKLHIGQVLILTYAEAIAVSLEKVSSGTPVKE